ncbi:hemerythrin domain-containing protein [Bacillus sp. B15-48]|uniref:hemerythrin domain-containing protein n=1 Tax=Bacillus sp. B15-48 TaxID=1548601 RepID=UPI00193FD559|nr:hemerythrin domain-containing protein [Bacillus sp. B15-48]MBM4763386.1 hemerythrin domain-containing protein [Bacillus sp. B15-48]
MSGPSLRKLDAHHAIHEGAYTEAKNLTEILNQLVMEKKEKEAAEVADALVEHWEMRIIGHADSEEEGFYPEVLNIEPNLSEKIAMLTRDHHILRTLAHEIRISLSKAGPSKEVLDRFSALLLVNEIHSRDEEDFLLGHEHTH